MACSKYEYVKKFEEKTTALLQTYIVVRIDGRGFTKFCTAHEFRKPNDIRALNLMNTAAQYVCESFTDIFLAYGQSDEYSFVFNKNTTLFSRRTDKILSCLVSAFTSAYAVNWGKHFDFELREIPTFDSRIVVYPNEGVLKDYFRWRQVDCHINNLYNTTFWEMVATGKSHQQVENILKETNSAQKNQILFSEFGINYNSLDEVYRRGTLLYYTTENINKEIDKIILPTTNIDHREEKVQQVKGEENKEQKTEQKKHPYKKQRSKEDREKSKDNQKLRRKLISSHDDCIKEVFWHQVLK